MVLARQVMKKPIFLLDLVSRFIIYLGQFGKNYRDIIGQAIIFSFLMRNGGSLIAEL
ncbi:MAG: hypothetical protein ACJA04_000026 [Cellvibrionaceae bacterium]|jgi:hypothetical protein